MTRATEIRAETTITKRLLRIMEMRILRFITGNRIRNKNICEIQNVIRRVGIRR